MHSTKIDGDKHAGRSKESSTKPKTDGNTHIIRLPKRIKMIYVGIDAHKKFLQIAAVDEKGKLLLNERVINEHRYVKEFFAQFPRDKTKCVVESSSVWQGLFRYIRDDLGFDIILSNPYQTKAIASSKKKTDKADAKILADLLRGDYVTECYVADLYTMESRELVRYRNSLVQHKTDFKNLIHAITLQKGIKIIGTPFTRGYTKQLETIGDRRILGYLNLINSINDEITRTNFEIKRRVEESKSAQLLKTIPGIGDYIALTISSEIGDISRFNDADKLCMYAGIVPAVYNSGEKKIKGRITKRGSGIMRWVLVEAIRVHVVHAKDSHITKFYNKLAKKKGKKKAAVAAAAKLLRIAYYMLKKEEKFDIHYGQNR